MTFAFPAWLTITGIAAIAGLLYVLQLLRVRHRDQIVVTTLFWREAVEETRARVLIRRFRHPWAFLLVLLIAVLIFLSSAEPQVDVAKDKTFVVLLDGSAAMDRGDLFAQAKKKVESLCQSLPPARRIVLLSHSTTETILAPNENMELMRQRLHQVQPQPCPSHIERHIRNAVAGLAADETTEVLVVSAVSPQSLQNVTDLPIKYYPVKLADTANLGITSLGISPARSGRWDRVDVLAEVMGGTAQPQLDVSLDGKPLTNGVVKQAAKEQQAAFHFVYRDVPAQGGKVVARLPADNFKVDDEAILVLPNRDRILVAIAPNVPAASARRIQQVIAVDDALQLSVNSPEVVIRMAGDSFGGSATAIELSEGQAGDAFVIGYATSEDAEAVLHRSLADLGLDQIDARGLAQKTGKKISVGAERRSDRRVQVWQELLSTQFNFMDSAAFPIFIGRTVRWLGGRRPVRHVAAVGKAVVGQVSAVQQDKSKLETAGAEFVPPQVGSYRDTKSNEEITASLSDPRLTKLHQQSPPDVETESPRSWSGSLLTLFGLLAFGLIVAEWFAYHRGSVP